MPVHSFHEDLSQDFEFDDDVTAAVTIDHPRDTSAPISASQSALQEAFHTQAQAEREVDPSIPETPTPSAFEIAAGLLDDMRVETVKTQEARVLASGGTFERYDGVDPFEDIFLGDFLSPVFLDMNGDGALDLVAGAALGLIVIYQGRADGTFGTWEGDNPFADIQVGNFAAPAFVDLDRDGDLDLVVGAQDGTVTAFRNGSIGAPGDFVTTNSTFPLGNIDAGTGAAPAFIDLDGDGDQDMVVGNGAGPMITYRNGGNGWSGQFSLWGDDDPFASLAVDEGSTPTFVDLDLDGDLDLVVGTRFGEMISFINGGNGWSGNFRAWGDNDPFQDVNVGQRSAPTFADLDNDGDLDMVTGAGYDGLVIYENVSGEAGRYDFAAPQSYQGTDEFLF